MKIKNILLLTILLLMSFQTSVASATKSIGDRLVISINSLPYTQRQVESYILIKESLRKKPSKNILYIDDKNWYVSLKVFAWDMLIEQEASRLGSFKASTKGIEKYRKIIEAKFSSDPELANRVSRLGIESRTLVRTLGSVLRVEAFRVSKEKQAALTKRETPKKADAPKIAKWLQELEERSVVRLYKNSDKYIQIQPTMGRGTGAL